MSDVMRSWLEIVPEWIQNLPEWAYNFCYNIYKSFIYSDRYMLFVTGIKNTLILTAGALCIGIVLGIVISLVRVSWDKNAAEMKPGIAKFLLRMANAASRLYLTIIRGTPVMVQILMLYLVFMVTVKSKLVIGIVAFGINSGAYVAEIFRGGIMSVDQGQNEAGRSLGFGYVQTMQYIILPQAFKTVLPTLANEFIVLIKETAVAGYIGLMDLTYASNIVGGISFSYFYPLLAAALVYLTLVIFFSWLVGRLERRLRSNER